MPNRVIQNKHTTFREIERLICRVHSNVSGNGLDGNASRIMVLLDAAVGFHGNHGDVEIGIPDNGLAGDAFRTPIRICVETFDLASEVKGKGLTLPWFCLKVLRRISLLLSVLHILLSERKSMVPLR